MSTRVRDAILPLALAEIAEHGFSDAALKAAADKAGVKPAPLADDATFLRRAALDITGKVPVVSEARKFLHDRGPEKRAQAIDKLLEAPGYVNNFTALWVDLLVLAVPDPEQPTTQVYAEGPTDAAARSLAQEYARRIRAMLR